jgi:GT2 family glycosyltransferase
MAECSIVIPIHNNVALTVRCLDALRAAGGAHIDREIIVVDDGSTDESVAALAGYGEWLHLVSLPIGGGFAAACNAGAGVARGDYLVFLNNDTIPQEGWLDALIDYAARHPDAGVVGSKLLYPDGTIQHAGVVIGQDCYPRHVYEGFPADHPAVNRSRRFPIVTGASACIPRALFAQVDGFDPAFCNGFEDVDLCLRLGQLGYEIHYCHESVLRHWESATRQETAGRDDANRRLYDERWRSRVAPDELDYYVADGLLTLGTSGGYPLPLSVSPLLAVIDEGQRGREVEALLSIRSRQVHDLLKETIRLSLRIAALEVGDGPTEQDADQRRFTDLFRARESLQRYASDARAAEASTDSWASRAVQAVSALSPKGGGTNGARTAQQALLRRDEMIEESVLAYQTGLAARMTTIPPPAVGAFAPGPHLVYQQLVRDIRERAATSLPIHGTVVVISKGDDALLQLPGRKGWHFPQNETGTYAGHYPQDSAAAIAHIEALRAKGGEFFLLPSTAYWWLDYYAEFGEYLGGHFPLLHADDICTIYDLRRIAEPIAAILPHESLMGQIHSLAERILPPTATLILADDGSGLSLEGVGAATLVLPLDGTAGAGMGATDTASVIARCEALRAQGGEYLIIPSAAYARTALATPLHDYLAQRYRLVVQQEHLCTIYALGERREGKNPQTRTRRRGAQASHGGTG